MVAFSCCHVAFLDFFCRCRGFCHRTESDIFLFLFVDVHYSVALPDASDSYPYPAFSLIYVWCSSFYTTPTYGESV